MKKILLIVIIFSFLTAQDFTVDKVNGSASVLKGTSEEWQPVKSGDQLSGDDLIATEADSRIILSRGAEKFILNSNSALNLGYIKEMTINDLLLALAMEDFKNLPSNKKDDKVKDTAVYGSEDSGSGLQPVVSNIGTKKINGAVRLSESGYKKSSVIAAKEIFRNYPETAGDFNSRVYFADILVELSLYEEAMQEFNNIRKLNLKPADSQELQRKTDDLKEKILTAN